MLQLYSPRDYVVYLVQPVMELFQAEVPWERSSDGHAGPGETSIIQAIRPELVDIDKVPAGDEGKARSHLQALRDAGVQTGIWWYADYPTHYQGDARLASPEAGEHLLDMMSQALIRAVRAIKEDSVTRQLLDEFYARSGAPSTA
jgi:creatinine amidohydrolase